MSDTLSTYLIIYLKDCLTGAPLAYFVDHGEWTAVRAEARRYRDYGHMMGDYSVLQNHHNHITYEQMTHDPV